MLHRQQRKTRSDIGRLVEVLKSMGTSALASVQSELRCLKQEDKLIGVHIREVETRLVPLLGVQEQSTLFASTWRDVGEILEAAPEGERPFVIRSYMDALELHPTDKSVGTYALRLFPDAQATRNASGADTLMDVDPVLFTDSSLVRPTDEPAPRLGLEPRT